VESRPLPDPDVRLILYDRSSTLRQTAIFDPARLLVQAYGYALYPLRELVFAGMLRNLEKAVPAEIGGSTKNRQESATVPKASER
jgi:hypothetical protein